MKCEYCDSKMYPVAPSTQSLIKNHRCKCGAHHYQSNTLEARWFTKKEWEAWVESADEKEPS